MVGNLAKCGKAQKLDNLNFRHTMEKLGISLVNMALPNRWFHHEMGLVDLTKYEVGLLHQYYEV